MPRLEEWSVIVYPNNPYQAPELWAKRLSGRIYEDERFKDGEIIITTKVLELNLKESYAQTKNTRYELGKPSEEYLEWLKENGKTLEEYF